MAVRRIRHSWQHRRLRYRQHPGKRPLAALAREKPSKAAQHQEDRLHHRILIQSRDRMLHLQELWTLPILLRDSGILEIRKLLQLHSRASPAGSRCLRHLRRIKGQCRHPVPRTPCPSRPWEKGGRQMRSQPLRQMPCPSLLAALGKKNPGQAYWKP
mgnify:CR=1 FL=1